MQHKVDSLPIDYLAAY